MAISCVSQFMRCRMKSIVLYGLAILLSLASVRCDNDIAAPSPGGNRDEDENNEENYDIYVNTTINICANVADGVYLPFVGDCDMFIECQNGTYTADSCSEIEKNKSESAFCKDPNEPCVMGFDYEYQVCTYFDADKCLPTCTDYELSSFCYDNTCTKYVLCYFGYPVLRECPDGLQYNNATDRCDFPQYVDCVSNYCSPLMQVENITYLASKASCSKYYICSNGKAWGQECSSGLLYNSKIKSCDYPKNVDCSITAESRNIKPFSRSPPRRADIACPARGINFFEHKSRRDAYYYCVNGNGVTLDCTPGLYYDPKIQECRESQYIYA